MLGLINHTSLNNNNKKWKMAYMAYSGLSGKSCLLTQGSATPIEKSWDHVGCIFAWYNGRCKQQFMPGGQGCQTSCSASRKSLHEKHSPTTDNGAPPERQYCGLHNSTHLSTLPSVFMRQTPSTLTKCSFVDSDGHN
jgi:hypothetical protein